MSTKVGSRRFPSTKRGMNAARRYAKSQGMDLSIGSKKKVTGRSSRKSGMTKAGTSRRRKKAEY